MSLVNCVIDYFRIAIQIANPNHQEIVKQNLVSIRDKVHKSLNIPKRQIMHSRNGYEVFLRVPLLSEFNYAKRNEEVPHIVVKCDYAYGNRYFLAIECKGHPYNKKQWFLVRLWLESILGYELLNIYKEEIFVTDFDITIGVDFPLGSYLFDFVWGQKSAWFTSKTGEFETIYIQPHNKRLEACIYNREAKVRNRGINKKIREPSRIELRFGKRKILLDKFFNTLDFLPKAFKRTRIYSLQNIIKQSDVCEDQIIALKAAGLVPYLRQISKYRREKFRKNIKPYLIPAIDFSKIEPLWNDELKKLKKIRPLKVYKGSKYNILRTEFVSTYFKD